MRLAPLVPTAHFVLEASEEAERLLPAGEVGRALNLSYLLGDDSRVEHLLHRALAELYVAETPDPEDRAWLLNLRGLVQTRRGALAAALASLAAAVECDAEGVGARLRIALRDNEALIHLLRADVGRARDLVEQALAMARTALPADLRAPLHVTAALVALRSGELDLCEFELNRARSMVSSESGRVWFFIEKRTAEVELARGCAARARARLQAALDRAWTIPPLATQLAAMTHLLAAALLAEGKAEDALHTAMGIVRPLRRVNPAEAASAMRVAGLACAALGRAVEARRAFAEALALLEPTELVHERQCLEAAIRHTGIGFPALPSANARGRSAAPRVARASEPVTSLRLRDGRCFVTSDRETLGRLRHAAADQLPVLIVGETGTGKELLAHLLHELGPQPDAPFVVVDCTTLPESLAEAELFGAARGAFSGAVDERHGLVAAANGGTLFFDELPELPSATQAKLLRLLQDGSYRRLGDGRPRTVRARIVASTNRDPESLVARGTLKPDLFYRLDGHRLVARPLRERPLDIEAIAHRLALACGAAGLSEAALVRMKSYAWPGNVRQLEMFIRAAAADLRPGAILDGETCGRLGATPSGATPGSGRLRERRMEAERETLRDLLQRNDGNVTRTARALGMSRQGLYKALRRTQLM